MRALSKFFKTALTTLMLVPMIGLGACAYFIDTSNQEITILTPGAQNAVCFMFVGDLRYRVHPPKTFNISKSGDDLKVDCLAPGNRRNIVVVEATITDSAKYNVANGGVGAIWDYGSKAIFEYPSIIEVNFTDTPTKSESLPAHNSPDIKQPEEYMHEEYRPGIARMNADKSLPPIEIRTRATNAPAATSNSDAFSESGSETSDGKGNLKSVLESYGSAIDPSDSSPTPLIPGE